MIARQIKPGMIVLVDEDTAWRELLFGEKPSLPDSGKVRPIYPGSDVLCTVEDLSEPPPEHE